MEAAELGSVAKCTTTLTLYNSYVNRCQPIDNAGTLLHRIFIALTAQSSNV